MELCISQFLCKNFDAELHGDDSYGMDDTDIPAQAEGKHLLLKFFFSCKSDSLRAQKKFERNLFFYTRLGLKHICFFNFD